MDDQFSLADLEVEDLEQVAGCVGADAEARGCVGVGIDGVEAE